MSGLVVEYPCGECGGEREAWIDCDWCGGEGYVEEPDWQEAMFEPERQCGNCGGHGGFRLCWNCATPAALEDAR